MPHSPLPTGNPDALRTFVHGNDQFRSYLTSGKGQDLEQARKSFDTATALDPQFHLARFYRALAESELRQAESAIEGFTILLKAPVKFRAEVLIHLAYAHIKRYRDADYFEAERLLKEAREEAGGQENRKDLQTLVDALTVFLYGVMGGRMEDVSRQADFLDKAIKLGEGMLSAPWAGRAESRFEVLNGLGIAYMRKAAAAEGPGKAVLWDVAQDRFMESLDVRPNAVRAMQNLGTMFGLQAREAKAIGQEERCSELWASAQEWLKKSLELNPLDRFPHYRMSMLFAFKGNWVEATQYYDSGKEQSGAVDEASWTKLGSAIQERDTAALVWQ